MTKDRSAYTHDQVDTLLLGYFENGVEDGFEEGYRGGYADGVSDTLCTVRSLLSAAISSEELEELGLAEVFSEILGPAEAEAPAPGLDDRLAAYTAVQLKELRSVLAA